MRVARHALVLPFLLASVSAQDTSTPGALGAQTGAVGTAVQGQLGGGNPAGQDTSGSGTLPAQTQGLPQGSTSQGTVLPGGKGANQDKRRSTLDANGLLSPLAPAPLTDFQRLVAALTGRTVSIYGADLFRGMPATFAPIDEVPVTPEYVIGPGDELLVKAWGQVTLDGRYTVDRSGNIFIPQVGSVRVAGLPFAKINDYLRSEMSRVFRNFDLNVNMGQLRSMQIFVVGEAARPGSYTVSSLDTLVNALFSTGGPNPQGSLRDIQLKRDGKVVVDFDLYDLLQKGDKSKDAQLLPGDVIYISHAGKMVAVVGSVNTPAIYELKPAATGGVGADLGAGSTVDEAIRLAGGLTSTAAENQIRIERVSHHSALSVLDVAFTPTGRETRLEDGDILEFAPILDRFKNAVTLRGNVGNPGRYVWREGMRIRDLIPDREALITRGYWQRHNDLGQSTLDYSPQEQGVRASPEGALRVDGDATSRAKAESGQASGARADSAQADSAQSTKGTSATRSTLGAASAEPARLFAAKTDIVLSAPDIDWSYAVIERQDASTLTTSLIPFNLGGAILDGDEKDNVELLPGDVVTIFSKADVRVPQSQQTRFVRLEGEFVAAGVYSVMPGETLRGLVARSGGLTSDAYLYGAEFTRESERRTQQQRLNDYVSQLDAQIGQASLTAASTSASEVDAAAALAAAKSDQAILGRLRQVKATGRIVLEWKPDSQGVDAVPGIPLEDGDRLVVPRLPSSVAVEGSVYNPNAFLYDPHRRVGDYLRMAGGGNRDADKHREFVIRADGSVISQQYSSSLRRGSFENARAYPGDTVVVPQNLSPPTTVRNLLNFSQIISQFGLGLAALAFIL